MNSWIYRYSELQKNVIFSYTNVPPKYNPFRFLTLIHIYMPSCIIVKKERNVWHFNILSFRIYEHLKKMYFWQVENHKKTPSLIEKKISVFIALKFQSSNAVKLQHLSHGVELYPNTKQTYFIIIFLNVFIIFAQKIPIHPGDVYIYFFFTNSLIVCIYNLLFWLLCKNI